MVLKTITYSVSPVTFQTENRRVVKMNKLDVVCVILQGPVLGPLLFILYVSDLYKVSNTVKPMMLADYKNLYIFLTDQYCKPGTM